MAVALSTFHLISWWSPGTFVIPLKLFGRTLIISPTARHRLVCALGQHSLVKVLSRCGLSLPTYFLADEKHSRCLTEQVYLPTIVHGRLIWYLGYTENASAVAFTQSYGEFQLAAFQQGKRSPVQRS